MVTRRLPVRVPCVLPVLVLSILCLAAGGAPAADFDEDMKGEIAVFRPGGNWYLLQSSDGYSQDLYKWYQWGADPTDTPVPGDYDGDGKADLAVYRKESGVWYILQSTDGYNQNLYKAYLWGGEATDTPVYADFDGDGKTDLGLFRKSSGVWYILNSTDGYNPAQYKAYLWGGELTDVPVPGDYDGDGKTDIAIFRASSGVWYFLMSSDGYDIAQYKAYRWGDEPTDIPVPGDYDGDGKTDIAVWRPSTGVWYILQSSDGYAQSLYKGYRWGDEPTDIPVPGDYDGDGKTDIAVWRPLPGTWYILQSSDGYDQGLFKAYLWGAGIEEDVPIQGSVESGDLGAIRYRLNQLQALADDNNLTPQTLEPFFHPDFLDEGRTRAEEIDFWTNEGEGPQPGSTFSNVRILSRLSVSPRRYLVSFLYSMADGKENLSSIVVQRDVDGAWKLYGDQRIMELGVVSRIFRDIPAPPASHVTYNGLGFDAHDGTGAAGSVQSVVVTGPGIPGGITMNRMPGGDGNSFWDNTLPFGIYNLQDDGVIAAIPDHAQYTFTLYSGTDGTGDVLHTYSVENPKRPYLWSEINDSIFPQLISPTLHELSATNPGGILAPIYSKPAGHAADSAELRFWSATGGSWQAFDSGNPSAYYFNSAGYGFVLFGASLQIRTVDTTTGRESGINWAFSPGTPVPYSLQLFGGSFLFLRDNSDGTKGYWHDVQVRNPDNTVTTDAARIQDFRCFFYPSMRPIPPASPWYLYWAPGMYVDGDGNGQNPPNPNPYSGIEGYLDVPVGTWPTGFTLCVVTDNNGKQQSTWLYQATPTEVPKVLSSNMQATTNLDNSVTLSWVPLGSPPLDPTKHQMRVTVSSSIDYSGDGYDEALLHANLPWNASSYTIPPAEVTRLKAFGSLYWNVLTRENIQNVTNPSGFTRFYFTYRNNGETLPLTLP